MQQLFTLLGAKMGLAAYGLTRNLFEAVLGTLYLTQDENRYDDFLRFGTRPKADFRGSLFDLAG